MVCEHRSPFISHTTTKATTQASVVGSQLLKCMHIYHTHHHQQEKGQTRQKKEKAEGAGKRDQTTSLKDDILVSALASQSNHKPLHDQNKIAQ